ncbi:uncharacterized protein [Porites lutea]|uniref:uncharacterized protein n=1 Tax=Porites lutea TaxID=51062 RepID=UPI003CC554B1
MCTVPKELAVHKTTTAKGSHRVDSLKSAFIFKTTNTLIPVGSPICKQWNEYISKQAMPNQTLVFASGGVEPVPGVSHLQELPEPHLLVEGETGLSSAETTCSELSSDDLATELKRLEISSRGRDDETFLSPDTGSLVSSTSDEAPTTMQEPRKKLNEYLVSKNIPPITQPWMEWDKAGESTKKRYTKRTVEIFSSVLQDLTPNYAGSLWQAVVSSPAMNKALKLDELSQTSKNYLQALSEAYGKAQGWETRRQILSIMSGVASFNDISRFIPGLTRYRYSLANLHRLQYGSGAPTTHHPSPRIKVDLKQLDHFLSYITSPHLVQDLPFGQKTLKLSSGHLVEIPNVIRTMIPQRIARQYAQYCHETGFKPFSERTMLRVLEECKASVRKSLQGLDYVAADGARDDVCTADELKEKLLSHGGMKGVRVVSLDTIIETPDSGQTITGITKLNNFEFSSTESVTCWRAYCVGRGKIINPGSSSSKYGN